MSTFNDLHDLCYMVFSYPHTGLVPTLLIAYYEELILPTKGLADTYKMVSSFAGDQCLITAGCCSSCATPTRPPGASTVRISCCDRIQHTVWIQHWSHQQPQTGENYVVKIRATIVEGLLLN